MHLLGDQQARQRPRAPDVAGARGPLGVAHARLEVVGLLLDTAGAHVEDAHDRAGRGRRGHYAPPRSALYLDSLRAAGGGPVAVMNGSATLVWIDPNAFTMVSSKEHSAYTRGVLSLNHSPFSFM